jgi:nitrogen fixation/metabolism regulation signal transduction histidine kinase
LELQQTGIIDYWELWFRKMPGQCMANINSVSKKNRETQHSSLSLKNLIGAFIVLLIGFSLSLLVFICEQIASIFARRTSN